MKIGYIYNIISKDENVLDSYIGATSLNPKHRFAVHKCRSTIVQNRLYNFITENGGIKQFTFNVIEKYAYSSLYDLRDREKFYIKLLRPTLNSNVPNRKHLEYRKDNKAKFNNYMRVYYRNLYRRKRELKYYNC